MPPPPGLLPSPIYSKDKKQRSSPPSSIHTFFSRRIYSLLTISSLFFLAGIAGIAFTATNLRRPPRTVTVFRCGRAEDSHRTYRSKVRAEEGIQARPKILGFVGVQTGFSSPDRRMALRSTWFPATAEGLIRLDLSLE